MSDDISQDLVFCDDCGMELHAKDGTRIKFLLGEEQLFDLLVCDECHDKLQVEYNNLKNDPV